MAKRHHWSEHRVLDEPDEKLYGTGARNHRLNEETVQARHGMCRLDSLEHCSRLSEDPVGITQIERDTANVALVRDVGRKDFQRDRKPDGGGDSGCLVRI